MWARLGWTNRLASVESDTRARAVSNPVLRLDGYIGSGARSRWGCETLTRMSRMYVPARSVTDWQALLADPKGQWKTGFSAKALAYCWQEADDFPPSVRAVFEESLFPLFYDIELLLAIPEHKVPLPGGRRASQTDLFVLARSGNELISVAVEGKVDEPFDETVGDWLSRRAADEQKRGREPVPSTGARERLTYLCGLVGLPEAEVSGLRYQLLHRTASALIEARRFNARHALMLVHSFSQADPPMWLDDFKKFAGRLKCEGAAAGTLVCVGERDGIDLYLGWATGDQAFLDAEVQAST